jgi:effector-binding domain-containing protein
MKTYDVTSDTIDVQPAAVMRTTVTVDQIGPWIGTAYGAIAQAMAVQGLSPAGMPFARYHRLTDDRFTVEAGFPTSAPIRNSGEVQASTLPGGNIARTLHIGPYDEMAPAYTALLSWIGEHGYVPDGDPWEIYLTEPGEQPDPAQWRTEIIQAYH